MKKETVLFIAAVSAILLYACSTSIGGGGADTGSFTITIGDGSGRTAMPWDPNTQIEDLDLIITVYNGPGPVQKREGVRAGQTINFTVVIGRWEVSVEAYKDGVLKAVGYTTMNVKAGPNDTVRVTMKSPDGNGGGQSDGEPEDSFTIFIGLLSAQSTAYGTVTIIQGNASGNKKGDTVTVTVTPKTNYYFVKWVSGDNINSSDVIDFNETSAPNGSSPDTLAFIFTINANTTLYAVFDGDGTNTPRNITNRTELEDINTNLSGKYALMTDIDLSGTSWTPIGKNASNQFAGTFDGNGKTITGLTITATAYYQGMFGYIDSTGVVKNLGLKDITISHTGTGQESGGIASNNYGLVENCFVAGTSVIQCAAIAGGVVGRNTGGTVQNCYSTATVTANGNNAGGIVGYIGSGIIQNCYATGVITGTGNNVGGIAGNNSGTVQNCVALNPDINSGTSNYGRVTGTAGSGTPQKNYGRDTMTHSPAGSFTNDGFMDGQNVSSGDYGNENWWKTSSNWNNTSPAFVWNFTTDWEWNAATSLPILRGFAPNTQNHKVVP